MSDPIVIHKNRTNVIIVNLGVDISGDTFSSEIRTAKNNASPLIATWDIDFVTNGVDGALRLTLDDSVTGPVTEKTGYMDLKRVTGGEPVPVFDEPLTVKFKDTVTA